MKSTVEKLSPTRVRINVEVPFTELQPDFDRAYKELAKQVRLPGFRPGKAPAKLLEARIGKEAMLDQVVGEAVPGRYTEAVTSSDVQPLGQPEIEITNKEYGQDLTFTAEVDVRPEIEFPDLEGLKITVDPIEVTDEEVDAELQNLRARFGTLNGVERAAETGDFVSIDLSATVDGEDVPEATTEGLSHEIGSGQLIEGLDEAVVGLKEEESRVFTTTLAAGEHVGKEAQVTVTVKSVKERELPEPDDEFAQLASEFDTIDELKNSLTEQVQRVKRIQQAEQIRDKALEVLLEQIEVPLPEKIVQAQVDDTLHNAIHGLDHDEKRVRGDARGAGQQPRGVRHGQPHQRGEGRQDPAPDGRGRRQARHPGRAERPDRAARPDVAAVRNGTAAAAAVPAAEQPAARDVRRRASWPDRRGGSARRHRHRHRRQRDRHHGVLRPVGCAGRGGCYSGSS